MKQDLYHLKHHVSVEQSDALLELIMKEKQHLSLTDKPKMRKCPECGTMAPENALCHDYGYNDYDEHRDNELSVGDRYHYGYED